MMSFLIEPTQAQALLESKNLLIIDLSQAESYQLHHIPGAINLQYEHIIHGMLPAPGGLPAIERLQALFNALGLKPDTQVLIYDDEGNGKACRFLWTLDMIGHQHYQLINGGIHSWVNEGHPISQKAERPKPSPVKLSINPAPCADKAYIKSILHNKNHLLLDVRTADEFNGVRGGMRLGHIPGAINFNWLGAIDRQNNMRFCPDAYLEDKFSALGLDKNKEIITYCYTHHRAAHTYAVLKHLGYKTVKGYAGSWAEWSADPSLPIE